MRHDWRGNVSDGTVSFTENYAAKLDSAEISSMEICAVKIHMPKKGGNQFGKKRKAD